MKKEVFLTFDDGPNEYTLKILEGLKKFDARATFFVCGKNLEKFPEIAKKIINDGQRIGNHTFSHSINFLFPQNFQKEIERTSKMIEKITGYKRKIFRPPWGILTPGLKKCLLENNYQTILWDIDSGDWRKYSAKTIAKRVLKKIKSNSILLFHDCLQTSLVLPQILNELKEKGYNFKKL